MKYQIQQNQIINYWIVLEENPIYKIGINHRFIKCKCKCGKISEVRIDQLLRNKNKSCEKCSIHLKINRNKTIGDFSRSHFNDIKSSANSRKLEFNITQEYLWELYLKQNKKCKISGTDITLSPKIVNKKADRKNISASLDRIDSNIGYTTENVQWVHKWINIMKGALSDKDFIGICKIITEYNKSEDNIEPSSMNGYMQRKSVYSNREGATHSD